MKADLAILSQDILTMADEDIMSTGHYITLLN